MSEELMQIIYGADDIDDDNDFDGDVDCSNENCDDDDNDHLDHDGEYILKMEY